MALPSGPLQTIQQGSNPLDGVIGSICPGHPPTTRLSLPAYSTESVLIDAGRGWRIGLEGPSGGRPWLVVAHRGRDWLGA